MRASSASPTTLRVVVVHNYYGSGSPSGENTAVDAEVALLRSKGVAVAVLSRSSDAIRSRGWLGAAAGGLSWVYNPLACRSIRDEARAFAPDVIHVHNTFPMVSNGVFSALRGVAPRVLTLHNYRLVCPAAIPIRNGKPCTLCLENKSGWPGVWHACYRRSSLATLPLAVRATIDRARKTWVRDVEAFIVLSQFQRRMMASAGLPTEKMHVRPNPYFGTPHPLPWKERDQHVVFVGRLAFEKGVLDLVEAWRQAGPEAPLLRVVGDGPARAEMEHRARGQRIIFAGPLPQDAATREIARAKMIVVPSRWFEGFPLVVSEALAHGTPLAVADIGPLREIVEDADAGQSFAAGNPQDLWRIVSGMWANDLSLQFYSANALARYQRLYTAEAAFTRLMEIYSCAGARFSRPGPHQ